MKTYTMRSLCGSLRWLNFNRLSRQDYTFLEQAFSEGKIHVAIVNCKGNKALGLDDFNVGFFNSFETF